MLNNPNNPLVPPGQTPPGTDPPGQTPQHTPPSGQTPGQQPHISTDHWTEEDREYIRRLRKEAEEANEKAKLLAKANHDAEKAKQQAEEQRLQEQGEYKKLAEKHQARVQELEPIAARYQTLASLVSAQIEAEVKDWPAEVKTFDPGNEAPIEQRLDWRNKSRPLIEKLQFQAQGQLPGNRPNPPPAGGRSMEERVKANMDDLKKQRTYGI